MNSAQRYSELSSRSKSLKLPIVVTILENIDKHFNNLCDVTNLRKNISDPLFVASAPVREINNSNLVCYAMEGANVIFIDEEILKKKPNLVNNQLVHELLHAVSKLYKPNQYYMGHMSNPSSPSIYIGMNEACTQMFAEDISGVRLSEDSDYLYFIKNVMRVFKVLFGEGKLADQYLNNLSNEFEQIFNNTTYYKFTPCVILINDIYKLSKKKFYEGLSKDEDDSLEEKRGKLIHFIRLLITNFSNSDPEYIDKVRNELGNIDLLADFGVAIKIGDTISY